MAEMFREAAVFNMVDLPRQATSILSHLLQNAPQLSRPKKTHLDRWLLFWQAYVAMQ